MAVQSSSVAPASMDPRIPTIGFADQFKMMLRAFWRAKARPRIIALTIGLLGIILLTVFAQLALNRWNVPFYNALERRSLPDFLQQLQVFFAIAGALLVLNVCQAWLNQMLALSLREGLTHDLVDHWLRRKRAIRLASSSPLGINPDQRLHEDARNLSDMSTSLSIGMVQATILLVSFVGVLWTTSGELTIPIAGTDVTIPGYMVWAAVIYAGLASILTRVVGRQLVNLNVDRSAREADLRAILMRTNEGLGIISIAGGQERERMRIGQRIGALLGVFRDLAWAQTRLTWVSAGFGWLAQIVPLVAAAPAYFSGSLSFGGLMMAAGAFSQVNIALQWYVTNFGMISNWRATLQRISTFRQALVEMDAARSAVPMINYSIGDEQAFVARNIEIALDTRLPNSGRLSLAGPELRVAPGERVLIEGKIAADHQTLFRTLAGDWPWGSGEVIYPQGRDVTFVSKPGQLPAGTIRELLCYPHAPSNFQPEILTGALSKVGLSWLSGMLDVASDWQRSLDREEQARLTIAGLLVLRPRFIVLDDFFEELDSRTRKDLIAILAEMPDRAILYIGRSSTFREAFSPTIVRLDRTNTALTA